jgi:hypothetical protein
VNPATGRAPAVTTNTPTSAEIACALRRRFPGALIWQGKATGHWWAYVPVGPHGRLIEAAYPAQLAHWLERFRQDPPPAQPSRVTALAHITSGLTKPGGGR